jgi:hypothetical protein
VEQAFSHHFKLAKVMNPEVNSQLEALKKAQQGFKTALAVQEKVNNILGLYPDDKTAQRAAKDADVMVRRFQRHAESARKIIVRITKKDMPPALKKLMGAVSAGIRRRLVDTKKLQVIPWQVTKSRYLRGGYRGRQVEGVEYQVIFRIDDDKFPGHNNRQEMTLTESTLLSFGPFIEMYDPKGATTTREAVAHFVAKLDGWPGMKGETEAISGRATTAKGVARALNSAIARMGGWMSEKAEISADNKDIEGSYRSDLPKEGAYDVGEYEYERMVDAEIKNWRKVLDSELRSYTSKIKRIDVSDGEKSWIYTTITLK